MRNIIEILVIPSVIKMKIRENMIIPFEKIPGCLAFKVKVTIEVQF